MIYCNELKIRYENSSYYQTGSGESWSKSLCKPELLVQISAGDSDDETTEDTDLYVMYGDNQRLLCLS